MRGLVGNVQRDRQGKQYPGNAEAAAVAGKFHERRCRSVATKVYAESTSAGRANAKLLVKPAALQMKREIYSCERDHRSISGEFVCLP